MSRFCNDCAIQRAANRYGEITKPCSTCGARPARDEMKSGWLITVDSIFDGQAVGTMGPRETTLTADEIKKHPKRQAFKMFDDDGILYYRGFNVEGDDDDGFEPLDHFGMPNAGCTEIKYKNDKTGAWETL